MSLARLGRMAVLGCGLTATLFPSLVHSQTMSGSPPDRTASEVEQHLKDLKASREQLERTMQDFDARIDALEAEVQRAQPAASTSSPSEGGGAALREDESDNAASPYGASSGVTAALQNAPDHGFWGSFEPGKGFVAVRTDEGEHSREAVRDPGFHQGGLAEGRAGRSTQGIIRLL